MRYNNSNSGESDGNSNTYVGPPYCGLKCMLAASRAAPGELRWVCRRNRQTDRRTDVRPLHYAVS